MRLPYTWNDVATGDIIITLLLFGPGLVAIVVGVWLLSRSRSFPPDHADQYTRTDVTLDYAKPGGQWGEAVAARYLLLQERWSLGRWPQPGVDPMSPWARVGFWFNFVYLLVQPLIVVIALPIGYWLRRQKAAGLAFLAYGIASLLNFAFFWFSPFGAWVLD